MVHADPTVFLNFIRAACQTAVTVERGIGGALLTTRVDFGDDGKAGFAASAKDIAALEGVTGVHVGVADPTVTSIRTARCGERDRL